MLNSLFDLFKPRIVPLTDSELIKMERNKRMPLFGSVHFPDGNHASAMGPGMKIISQSYKAIDKGIASEIPNGHPAQFED